MNELSVTGTPSAEPVRPVATDYPRRSESAPTAAKTYRAASTSGPNLAARVSEPFGGTRRAEVSERAEVSSSTAVSDAYAKFTFHPKSGAVSIKIIDARTDTVIREVPAEEVIKMAEELQALARRSIAPAPGYPRRDAVPEGVVVGPGVDGYA